MTAVQVRCWHCDTVQALAPVCERCATPLELPADADAFALLGLPVEANVDPQTLRRLYLERSALLHPDRHAGATPRARAASLAGSARLNRAYRTLRDPVTRAGHLLEILGHSTRGRSQAVRPQLAEFLFAVRDEMEALDASAGGEARRAALLAEVDRRLDEVRKALQSRLDQWTGEASPQSHRDELQDILSELAYLGTVRRDLAPEEDDA